MKNPAFFKTLIALTAVAFAGLVAEAQTMAPMGTMGAAPTAAPTTRPTAAPKPITINLDLSPTAMDMDHLRKSEMGYMPAGVQLVDDKPAAITREPAYMGKPKYGAFRIGNGPRSITYFAVDEAKGQTGRIYIDLNQNGDLTDDGPGAWDEATEYDGILNYKRTAALHASWGSPVKEDEGGSYSILMYRRQGDTRLFYTKVSARSGNLTLDGKTYPVLLVENSSDGIFTVPAKNDRTRRPVTFLIDFDGDGTFKGASEIRDGKKYFIPEQYSLTDAIKLNDHWWLVRPSVSGSELMFFPAVAPNQQVAQAPQPVEGKVLLAAGTPAPDFTAETPSGKPISLSDFKGKVVILDFWATWCGPCQASMPGLQKTYDGVKDQGVVVLSVNVFDDKDPFDVWIANNSGSKYNFTFAYDPAGRDIKKSIAATKFGVSGIPTMYVIDREGKVAAALVGAGKDSKLVAILNSQGIQTKAD